MNKEKFYQLKKNSDDQKAELYLYGEITSIKWFVEDVTSYDLAQELIELGSRDLVVRINSYGGEAAVGLAIYNLLKAYPGKVTTICDGFACSAASVIFMAGTERITPKSSLLMIHNVWTTASGDANELRKAAEDVEKITQPSIEIYKENSNLSYEEIKTMMDEERWITADEALSYGFATSIVESMPQQSVQDTMLNKLVLKNKELEQKIKESTQPTVQNGWFF